jgi:D-glycero-alpha-D-manno-heptose-7-phosphate kinase
VITTADLPTEGTGLGSSSALTVGLLHALYTYRGETVSEDRLAEEACDVELNMVGSPIGKQDQYIAVHGGITRFDFRQDGAVVVRPVPVPEGVKRELARHLLLFYTGMSRLANPILQEQAANTHANLELLHRIRRRVEPAWEILSGGGDLDEVGAILHESWEDKRRLASGITNGTIDALYGAARSVSNRIGGKICGAGGGGFLLLYVPPEYQPKVRSMFDGLLEARVGFSEAGSRVVSLHEAIRRYQP